MDTIILDDRNASIYFKQESYSYSSIYNTYKPDPAWCYQDAKGHIHRWDLATKTVPTIKKVVDEVHEHCDEDGECWTTEDSHQECILCGEHVEPDYLIDIPAGRMQDVPLRRGFSGRYSPKLGEECPELGYKRHFKLSAYEFDAFVTDISILTPVTHPNESGITVRFSGIGEMTTTSD